MEDKELDVASNQQESDNIMDLVDKEQDDTRSTRKKM